MEIAKENLFLEKKRDSEIEKGRHERENAKVKENSDMEMDIEGTHFNVE